MSSKATSHSHPTQPIARWAEDTVTRRLAYARMVTVLGCRASGKTTLLTRFFHDASDYKNLDDPDTLIAAKDNPNAFVRHQGTSALVIDEIAKALPLIGSMKFVVDQNPTPSQYLLAGSADYRRVPHAIESLAGRNSVVRLRTLSEAEKRGQHPNVLRALMAGKLPRTSPFPCSLDTVLPMVLAGGFPALNEVQDPRQRMRWLRSYRQRVIPADLKAFWNVRKVDRVDALLVAAAQHSSTIPKLDRIAADLSLAWATVSTYWDALEALFLIDSVPGWGTLGANRARFSPKVYMTDSALMAHLLGITSIESIRLGSTRTTAVGEQLLKTWVYNQLMPEIDAQTGWSLCHVTTRQHTIDFVITNDEGAHLGISVVGKEGLDAHDVKHVQWLKRTLGDRVPFRGLVLYLGNYVRTFREDCFGLPVSVLWSDPNTW